MRKIIIVSPSLDANINISGISTVSNFIIHNNKKYEYIHFQLGKTDKESGILKRFLRICLSLIKWIRLLKQKEKTIIHYNFPLNTLAILRDFLFMWICIRKSIPMIIHVHGGVYLSKQKKPIIIRLLLKKIFKWKCTFIMLSDKEKADVIKHYNVERVFSLPNCIELDNSNNFSRKYESKLDILFLGRIEPNKGVEYILKASTILKKQNKNFVLHFAGKEDVENKYVPLFKQKLTDNFVYEGVVSGERKAKLLEKCNVFLLPSFFEGLPMSLLETMSYGIVPITTDVGSISVYVKDKVNGLIIKKKDTNSIVNSINYLINHNDLMVEMSKKAKQTLFKEFSPSKYIEKLNSIYNMALSHK